MSRGSASARRPFPGFERYDESRHRLQRLKPGAGIKDAPGAFSLKLRKTTWGGGVVLNPHSTSKSSRQALTSSRRGM
eukprot:3460525-Pyramimonas_sp.AAC.1